MEQRRREGAKKGTLNLGDVEDPAEPVLQEHGAEVNQEVGWGQQLHGGDRGLRLDLMRDYDLL